VKSHTKLTRGQHWRGHRLSTELLRWPPKKVVTFLWPVTQSWPASVYLCTRPGLSSLQFWVLYNSYAFSILYSSQSIINERKRKIIKYDFVHKKVIPWIIQNLSFQFFLRNLLETDIRQGGRCEKVENKLSMPALYGFRTNVSLIFEQLCTIIVLKQVGR
jgi:hypothetical protein